MQIYPEAIFSPVLFAVLLGTVRLSALFLAIPLFSPTQLPSPIRVSLVVGLAAALAAGLHWGSVSLPPSWVGIFNSVLSELALGLLLSLGALLAFGAVSVAGRVLDIQIGFGIGQVFDPISRQQLPILTTVFNQVAALLFFTTDAHHTLLRGLALSFEYFPIGMPWPLLTGYELLLTKVGAIFLLGFALVAPVVLSLLLIELALGVVARSLPQMNMFVMGTPVKILVGLTLLTVWASEMGKVMAHAYTSIYNGWEQLFLMHQARGS